MCVYLVGDKRKRNRISYDVFLSKLKCSILADEDLIEEKNKQAFLGLSSSMFELNREK